jgi:hypothetical protein
MHLGGMGSGPAHDVIAPDGGWRTAINRPLRTETVWNRSLW